MFIKKVNLNRHGNYGVAKKYTKTAKKSFKIPSIIIKKKKKVEMSAVGDE